MASSSSSWYDNVVQFFSPERYLFYFSVKMYPAFFYFRIPYSCNLNTILSFHLLFFLFFYSHAFYSVYTANPIVLFGGVCAITVTSISAAACWICSAIFLFEYRISESMRQKCLTISGIIKSNRNPKKVFSKGKSDAGKTTEKKIEEVHEQ